MNAALQDVVKGELDLLGYDLVLLRQGGTRARPLVEVRIDRRDGQQVSIQDCVRVSKVLETRLDAMESSNHEPDASPATKGRRYELQVSSPGRGSLHDRIN